MALKDVLKKKIEEHRPRTTKLLKEHGDAKVGEVTIAQAIGGARGVRCLVTDISYLDPHEGIRFRGRTIPEVMKIIPKPQGKDYPYVEAFWHYLITGEVPTDQETKEIVEEFKKRRSLPQYVIDVLRAMPRDTHPMTMFSAAILSMQRESKFVKFYNEGFDRMTAWEPMYEDATDLLAKLPLIAAYIYRMKYKADRHIPADDSQDFGGNLPT